MLVGMLYLELCFNQDLDFEVQVDEFFDEVLVGGLIDVDYGVRIWYFCIYIRCCSVFFD